MSEENRREITTDEIRDSNFFKRAIAKAIKNVELQIRNYFEPIRAKESQGKDKATECARKMLQGYRQSEKDSVLRLNINQAMDIHKKLCQISGDRMPKVRHNLLVMEYMIENPISHIEIQRRLQIGSTSFYRQREKGIKELGLIMSNDYRLIR